MLTEDLAVVVGLIVAVAAPVLAAATGSRDLLWGVLLGLGLVLWAERD